MQTADLAKVTRQATATTRSNSERIEAINYTYESDHAAMMVMDIGERAELNRFGGSFA